MGNSGSEPAGPGPAGMVEAEAGPSQGQAPPGTPGEEPRRAPPAAPGPPTPAEELHGETRRHCGSAALHETPTPRAILRRESGQAFGRRVKRCIAGRFIPSGHPSVVDRLDARAYIGRFAPTGNFFVAGFQDRRVRVYRTAAAAKPWRLHKEILAKQLNWTITDTAMTADDQFLAYATISPVVQLVNLNASSEVHSVQNVTDIHEPLDFSMEDDPRGERRMHGIWSIKMSRSAERVIAGTSDPYSIAEFDVPANRVVLDVQAHDDDVNSVAYLDDSENVVLSGSDDAAIKLWDKRLLGTSGSPGEGEAKPAGVFYGHTEGITFLAPKGDGRYFLSNGKDQKAKLWDVRAMGNDRIPQKFKAAAYAFDYRWQRYPKNPEHVTHPYDTSVMSFIGHKVLNTLIRVNWSPMETTGQRYVFSGSACGAVYVYDVLTGEVAAKLKYHNAVVRDCDWHPSQPVLASVGWDGYVARWANFDAPPPPPQRGPKVDNFARMRYGMVTGDSFDDASDDSGDDPEYEYDTEDSSEGEGEDME